jgi:hypothetical protein
MRNDEVSRSSRLAGISFFFFFFLTTDVGYRALPRLNLGPNIAVVTIRVLGIRGDHSAARVRLATGCYWGAAEWYVDPVVVLIPYR